MQVSSCHSGCTNFTKQKATADIISGRSFEARTSEWWSNTTFKESRLETDTAPFDLRTDDFFMIWLSSIEELAEKALKCSIEVESPWIEVLDRSYHVIGTTKDQCSSHSATSTYSGGFLSFLYPSVLELFVTSCMVMLPLNHLNTLNTETHHSIRLSRVCAEVTWE